MLARLIFGAFYEVLIFSIAGSILRKYSSSVHASSQAVVL
ncbi:accessory gene regulator B family protein [Clostridium beijerinckii]|nr:accessory gene regulator B family protein [Clostridium beijerinckii]UYZ38404.1 accessory gene regulator B family protein [Clostridium beijerinckii]